MTFADGARTCRLGLSVVAVAALATLASCGGDDDDTSSADASTTTSATTTTVAATTTAASTTDVTTTIPASTTTAASTTTSTTEPSDSGGDLYDEVSSPDVPDGHTDAPPASGDLPDGAYWTVYSPGTAEPPTIVVMQAFFGQECIDIAAFLGEECLNDIFVLSDPSLEIDDLPFADGADISITEVNTGQSYAIDEDELAIVSTSTPSEGAPEGFFYVDFSFLMTVEDGEIVGFEQVWTP